MGYCGCMGYGALFPANQLGGLKNVWNLREYGVCEPWVKRESTVSIKRATQKYSIQHTEQLIKTSVQERISLRRMESLW